MTIVGWFLFLVSITCSQHSHAKHLLVFGDSLSAAYGMDIEQGWVHLLSNHWSTKWGAKHQISNASISGETTISGLARLPLILQELKPDIVLIELGANDGLRGYPIKKIHQNLNTMVNLIQQSGASAIITGISVPPSYGPRYTDQFRNIFQKVASDHELPFIDFYQENFFDTPGYIQSDGLHPTPITQPIIRDMVITFFSDTGLLN